MRLNTIKLLTTVLSLTGTMILSTGCTKSGLSANSLQADLNVDNSSDKLRRRGPASSTTTRTLPPVVTPSVAKLQLTNLPTASDTTASIGYSLSPADPSLVVYCRRDSYAPGICPNPFVLGATTPLSGSHTIDFYVDRGSGINAAAPEISYQWNITAIAPTPTPATLPPAPAPLPVPSGVTPLASLGGIPSGGQVSDPNGSGRTVNLHRIYPTGTVVYGGIRDELFYYDHSLTLGTDYWMAFAFQMKSDEELAQSYDNDGGDMLIMQTHTPATGDTQPPIALYVSGHSSYYSNTPAGRSLYWGRAYNTVPDNQWSYNGGSSPDTEKWTNMHQEPIPPRGTWYRYLIHIRPGWNITQAPMYEVWRAKQGQGYEQLFSSTGFNDYNIRPGVYNPSASYPRIGLYKWSGWHGESSIAFYETPIYWGQGLNLYNEAAAALSGIGQ